MFQEFVETGSVHTYKTPKGTMTNRALSDQFDTLRKQGNDVSQAAYDIRDLLEQLRQNSFVKECDAVLTSLRP